jgi:hypothetical protein
MNSLHRNYRISQSLAASERAPAMARRGKLLTKGNQIPVRLFHCAAAFVCLHLLGLPLLAERVELSYYLPSDHEYQDDVPSPSDHFGFQIGERHLEHAELIGYFKQLSSTSDRVICLEYARSHGGRPLILAIITSPENHDRLEEIRKAHLQQLRPTGDPGVSAETSLDELPLVINMGYGVHGDEPSASNAAPLIAYHLAASRSEEVESLLSSTVVLIDPCLNPDGFERFAHWANNHRGRVANADPNHREHQQGWPSGRTNYYWFDLNRDWLPAQHPESRGRLIQYHRWMPHVLLDYHEMGTGSSYFFQPGVEARNYPRIPKMTRALTETIGKFHAAALDEIGSLYFTRERFDDFYPGKGSTYPDLHGGVGILFEQASSRGHVQEGKWGELSFPFTIRNHVRTSLSSLRGADALREELQENLRTFYRNSLEMARHADVQGYLVSAPNDPARLHAFAEILRHHHIQAYWLREQVTVHGETYRPVDSLVIPGQQPEYRFLRTLFDRETDFPENVFYDVSSWTLPAAFNLQWTELSEAPPEEWLGEDAWEQSFPSRTWEASSEDLAYIVDYRGYYAPRTLYRLLKEEIQVGVAEQPFVLEQDGEEFDRGTLVVPLGIQPDRREQIVQTLRMAAAEDGVAVSATRSGLTTRGIDLGSDALRRVRMPRILLVVGGDVSPYEAGEIWHVLDERFGIPVSLVDMDRFSRVNLHVYTHVLLPSGGYSAWGDSTVSRLQRWLRDGGTLLAQGRAISWINSRQLTSVELREGREGPVSGRDHPTGDVADSSDADESVVSGRRPFASAEKDHALGLLRGAIFRVNVDRTHPLAYGYSSDQMYVFRNQRLFLEPARNVYSTPVAYLGRQQDAGHFAGYVPASDLDPLADSASVLVQQVGSGRIIIMVDNPNFRGHWYGTTRLFCNALFFGPLANEP